MVQDNQSVRLQPNSFVSFLNRVRSSVLTTVDKRTLETSQIPEIATKDSFKQDTSAPKNPVHVNFQLSTTEMIERWQMYKGQGNVVPLNIQDPQKPEKALFKFAEKNLTKEQQVNMANFVKDLLHHDRESVSHTHRYLANKSFVDLFRDELRQGKITFEQLDAIGDGDFTFDAYKKMILQSSAL